jgi:putative hydrolase of the HAD superfamily
VTVAAVVFDWGGTLAEISGFELEDLWRLAARKLDPASEEALVRRLLEVEAAAWARTATTHRSTTLLDLLREATEELGLDVTGAALSEAERTHLEGVTPHIRHDADARRTLEALRARGLRIGLLSNTHWPRRFHEEFLERDGLAELIDARIYTSELRWVKPHPAAFRTVLDALGIDDPGGAVFVGDRPLDDVRGAQQAGMRAILRARPDLPPGPVTPEATITSLPEVVGLVDGWGTPVSPPGGS